MYKDSCHEVIIVVVCYMYLHQVVYVATKESKYATRKRNNFSGPAQTTED
jgi:hypothetical protein